MPSIPTPSFDLPIVDKEGMMTDAFQRWITQMTNLDLIVGTGTPEGAVEAFVGREYMDDVGTTGSIKYIKRDSDIAGDKTKGWILV